MLAIIPKLEEWALKDTKVRAVLRRSLAFDPGTYPPSFPLVEWSIIDDEKPWSRKVQYLVAGLWAQHWRDGRDKGMPIGKACANYFQASGSATAERRFVALLDADSEQLPHRLRQLISLLKDYPIDFEALRHGLLRWNRVERSTQVQWARDFYRTVDFTTAETSSDNSNEGKNQ
jgi:CRISPR system Cascade subunit CasB